MRLSEVADFRLGKMLDQRKNKGDLLPYLANKNVRWGEFDLSEMREMRFEERELETFSLKNGDIVMCEGGVPGRCAIWRDQLPKMMYQKALHRIRPFETMNEVYLYYNLSYRAKSGHFEGLFTGSTIKHLPKEKLALVEVDVPDLPTQERIAAILSAYDDLIENNRRRIALLEQAARLLYREWFVHFRFPGHETAKFVDGLPEGWDKRPLIDLTTKLGSGATPRGGAGAYQEVGLTLIRSLNVYDYSFHDDGLVFLNEDQAKKLANVTVEKHDVLLNITGASVARCCMVPDRHLPARVNQHVMIVRTDLDESSPFFILHSINAQQNKEKLLSIARAGGATREALTKDVVGNFEILCPPNELITLFGDQVEQMHEQAETLSALNAQLTRVRDLLLPRLMDGRIPV
ncbi:type I restriction enzyme, S subunit [Yoonia rosea]|uniref:Type I restriction enzyme, S subunit n=2 Tax=Yoonia rosea TaxID=287098 RepID=A0A1R3WGI0_9RHOB|nr:type I restriction enzyme, S subunit [Yoonia rosea]